MADGNAALDGLDVSGRTYGVEAAPLSEWLRDARVLEVKSRRPSVLELDGRDARARRIVKLWWPRDDWPPGRARLRARRRARRFMAACAGLASAGIEAPRILRDGCTDGVWWVVYDRIPGVTLRELVLAGEPPPAETLAGFLAQLHETGVFFRALNLANVVRLPGAGFALIDVAGTRIHRRPLPERLRARNLASFITHPRDIGHMFGGFGQEMVAAYARRLPDGGARLRARVAREVARRTRRRMRRRARSGAAPLPIDHIPRSW